MKTIGVLGGMSWESTVTYYQLINQITKEKKGQLHSAPMVLISVDFQEIESCQRRGEWEKAGALLAHEAKNIERAGADFLVLCTNTMHKVAPIIMNEISIPFLHIAKATANRILSQGLQSVALLGTQFTMEQDFYRGALELEGLKVNVPDGSDRAKVHDIIYNELCLGHIKPESKSEYLNIIQHLEQQGAQGIIAGCTEIGLLIQQEDIGIPLFDTARIHAEAAVNYALEDDQYK